MAEKLINLEHVEMIITYLKNWISNGGGGTVDTEPGPEIPDEPEGGDEGGKTLIIHKDVDGDMEAHKDFGFEIIVGDEEADNITLNHDDEYVIKDLEVGTKFTITETDTKDADLVSYSVNGADYVDGESVSGEIGEEDETVVKFLNFYAYEEPEPNPDKGTGKVSITKVTEGETDKSEFNFEVTLDDETKSVTVVADGEPVELDGIDEGTTVTIKELDADAVKTLWYVNGGDAVATGDTLADLVVEKDATLDVTVVNSYLDDTEYPATIRLTKMIDGETDDVDFEFEVSHDDVVENITLSAGDYEEIEIPAGSSYTIKEVDPKNAKTIKWVVDGEDEYIEGDTFEGVAGLDEFVDISVVNGYAEEETPTVGKGTVKVTKKVDGTTEFTEFQFEALDSEGIAVDEAVINADETVVFELDAGATYTILEIASGDADSITYSVDGSKAVEGGEVKVDVVEGETIEIVFTNIYGTSESVPPEDDGTLIISKSVSGDTEDSDYVIEATDSDGNVVVSEVFNDGDSKEFSLVGGFYTITETDPKSAELIKYSVNGGTEVSGSSVTLEVSANKNTEVAFINGYYEPETVPPDPEPDPDPDPEPTPDPDPDPDPEPEPDPEPVPPAEGTLTISKSVNGTTEDSEFVIEVVAEDGTSYEYMEDNGQSTKITLEAGKYTVTEKDPKNADSVGYSLNGGDPVYEKSVEVEIADNDDISVAFTNYYFSMTETPDDGGENESPDGVTIPAGTESFNITLDTNADDISAKCECEKEIDWALVESEDNPGVMVLRINSAESSDEDYTAVFTITSTLGGVEYTTTYTVTFTANIVKTGTLSITKTIDVSPAETDRGTYKFELTVGDDDPEEIEITIPENKSTATVEKEVAVGKEFTLKEVDSQNADVITYSVGGSDDVEGDTVTGVIEEEDSTLSVDFTNTYHYLYMNPDHYTTTAGKSGITIVINTSGDASVECDCDKVEWELRDPSGFYVNKQIYIISSESSTEDYTATFTITSTLNGKDIVGTYTLVFEADEEPAPAMGTLSITKTVKDAPVNPPDRGTYKFELTVGDGETEEIELSSGKTVEKEILANAEFTLKEIDSEEADMVTYSVDGGDSIEGDTVIGSVGEDGKVSVEFLNTYAYLYLNPDHTTMKANSGTLTVVLNTNGTPTVTCDNDEMVDWSLSGKTLKITGSKSSTEDYTAVFTITCTLDNGKFVTGTYTIYFTADQEPEPEKTGTLSITKKVSDTNVNPPDRGTYKFELTVGDGEAEEIELAKDDTVEKEIKANTEFTLKEIGSNEADMVTYSVDGGDSIEGDTVTGSVGEDANVDVTFTNTYLYFYQSSNSSTMTAGNSVFIILNTNGTPSVTCDSNEDMIEWELSGKNLRILSSKSSPEDYTVTFTITCSLDNGKSVEGTYSITFKANEEKLEFDDLSSTSATYVSGGAQPVTLVFTTNGEVNVTCECDKEIDWELKDPTTGIVSIGYQLVINSTEKSDEDYDAVFTITSTIGNQEISQTFTLHLTANTD